MVKTLELPDELEVIHGDNMGDIGPEAKQYYQPYNPAEIINNIHVQDFEYRITFGERETTVILATIALDVERGSYYVFRHIGGISPQHGIVGALECEAIITNDGERFETVEEVPDKIMDSVEEYFHKYSEGEAIE